MQVSEAVKIWLEYHKSNSREKTLRTYKPLLSKFCQEFGERNLDKLISEEILSLLGRMTERTKQQTKRIRYSQLSAFFYFIRNNIDQNFRSPRDPSMMKRRFRNRPLIRWNTIEKDTLDEIIFTPSKLRNRLCRNSWPGAA